MYVLLIPTFFYCHLFRERRDLFVATILVLVVLTYMVCHSLKIVINVIELVSSFTMTSGFSNLYEYVGS